MSESIVRVADSNLAEISGLVFSLTQPDRLWIANDSGNPARLFALRLNGTVERAVNLTVENRDWEDLAVTKINSMSYVLVADIGDNMQQQSEYVVHFFNEATLFNAEQLPIEPTFSLRFRYEDQSHNSEALFTDGSYIYLLTKERLISGKPINGGVYQLPITNAQGPKLGVASRIATLGLPTRSVPSRILARISGLDMEQPTAAALSPSGNRLYVLNYRHIVIFTKATDESWGQALQRSGQRLHTHSLRQAEALGVAPNGDVWVMSEKLPADLWRFPGADESIE